MTIAEDTKEVIAEPQAKTVTVPDDVWKAFAKLRKGYKYMQGRAGFAMHCGIYHRTIDTILEKKTCGPDTLEKLYVLTGIEKPQNTNI